MRNCGSAKITTGKMRKLLRKISAFTHRNISRLTVTSNWCLPSYMTTKAGLLLLSSRETWWDQPISVGVKVETPSRGNDWILVNMLIPTRVTQPFFWFKPIMRKADLSNHTIAEWLQDGARRASVQVHVLIFWPIAVDKLLTPVCIHRAVQIAYQLAIWPAGGETLGINDTQSHSEEHLVVMKVVCNLEMCSEKSFDTEML